MTVKNHRVPSSSQHLNVFKVIIAVLLGIAMILFIVFLVQKKGKEENLLRTQLRKLLMFVNNIHFNFIPASQTQEVVITSPNHFEYEDDFITLTLSPMNEATGVTEVTLQPSFMWPPGKYILFLGMTSSSPASISTLALYPFSRKTMCALKKSSGCDSEIITIDVGNTDLPSYIQKISVHGYRFGNGNTTGVVKLEIAPDKDKGIQTYRFSPVTNERDSGMLFNGFIFPNQLVSKPPAIDTDHISLEFDPAIIPPTDAFI